MAWRPVDDWSGYAPGSLRFRRMTFLARTPPLPGPWRRLRRAVLVRRRLLAALLAVGAVLAGAHALTADPEPTVPVVVAAADLAGGAPVRGPDLQVVQHPEHAVPDGAFAEASQVTGRTLASPVRRGEPVTDVRVVAAGLLAGYPGRVATPVRIADPGAARLLQVGDLVDLVAVAPDRPASVVASSVPVVALPRPGRETSAEHGAGALVVVAVSQPTALQVLEASAGAVVSVVLTDVGSR